MVFQDGVGIFPLCIEGLHGRVWHARRICGVFQSWSSGLCIIQEDDFCKIVLYDPWSGEFPRFIYWMRICSKWFFSSDFTVICLGSHGHCCESTEVWRPIVRLMAKGLFDSLFFGTIFLARAQLRSKSNVWFVAIWVAAVVSSMLGLGHFLGCVSNMNTCWISIRNVFPAFEVSLNMLNWDEATLS